MFIDERIKQAYNNGNIKQELADMIAECKDRESIKRLDYAFCAFAEKHSEIYKDMVKCVYYRIALRKNVNLKGFFDFMGWSSHLSSVKAYCKTKKV